MPLTNDDLAFLRDHETWLRGPCFELILRYVGSNRGDEAIRSLLESDNVIGPFGKPEEISRECPPFGGTFDGLSSMHVVLTDPKQAVCPVGGIVFSRDYPASDETILWVGLRPAHVRRACGDDLWRCRGQWGTPVIIALHAMLIDLARSMHKRLPFRIAEIEEETWSLETSPDDAGIALNRDVALAAGWRVTLHGNRTAIVNVDSD